MIITCLEELEQSKIKVYIDYEYAFLLYRKDIAKYELMEGASIDRKLYEEIIEDTVYRRAERKALAILKFMDRSEQELRKKLSEAGYTPEIIDRAITYVFSYGYLNDERFAANYIRSRMKTKSKHMIRNELYQKGIDKSIIDKTLLDEYGEEEEDAEITAIRKAIAKKTSSPKDLSYEDKQKLIASLYRKGFEIGKINRILS